jgi:hypothetical protein
MKGALLAALDDLTKNIKKAPGWVPLSITCYLLLQILPPNARVLGISLHEHKEIVILLATLTLYLLGDALDEALFDRLPLPKLEVYRKKAREVLCMDKGYYEVAKALVVTAKRYEGSWIQVENEAAKFFRSMGCFTIIASVVLLMQTRLLWSTAMLLLTPLLIVNYVLLKAAHMRDIYGLVADVLTKSTDNYSVQQLPNGVRLFFWAGKLASSAPRAEKE